MATKKKVAPDGGGGKKGRGEKAQQDKGRSERGGPVKFARDVRGELRRVTWPNRDQLQQSTAVVLIIVLVLAAFVAGVDFVFQNIARAVFL
jgi:preprotein translocase subunit SecE